MRKLYPILLISFFILILPMTVRAEEDNNHEHIRSLQSIVVSNNDIPYEGEFYCSECQSIYHDTITYDDLGIPVINIIGSLDGISKTKKVTVNISYMSEEQSFDSSATLKVQGASSAGYPKKNYTVQFQKESGGKNKVKLVDSWGKQSKYCLKANYIDYSQSRNIVSARIYNEIVHSRDKDDELGALDNGGVIDGYPVAMFLNEQFLGLYTFNIPKDNWMFGMNDETIRQALLFGDVWADSVALRTPISDVNDVTTSGWDLEYCSTEDDEAIGTAWAAESMNEFIQFINENDGEDFKSGIDNYTDIDRAIDVLLYTYFIHASDNESKNIIWASYDGVKWIPSPYDMDGTWGLGWSGDFWYSASGFPPAGGNVLFQRLLDNYSDEIRERYVELRSDILSESNIQKQFALFFGSIPQVMYSAESEKWTAVPSQDTNNYDQIMDYIQERINYLDDYFGVSITENEETAFRVSFNAPTGTKVYIYDSQDYTEEPEKSRLAFSRTVDGNKTKTDGQVNFLVVPPKGYVVEDLSTDPADGYENIEGPEETGQDNTYRITNINCDLNVTIGLELDQVLRISGDTRYETSLRIADYYKEKLNGGQKFESVVISTGRNFPDALAGSYLANKKNAPIIMIDKASAANVVSYIKENLAEDGKIYVLGGEGAVASSWLGDLKYQRLSGADRYITNIQILNETNVSGGYIFVCTGADYADALSGSGLDYPILLVGKKLTDSQKAFLKDKDWNFIIIGGTGAVSENVEKQLKDYGTIKDRLAGSTRYDTSKQLADKYAGNARKIVMATGQNFPDGLCGGPVAYKAGAPIILSNKGDKSSFGKDYASSKGIRNGLVLGGAGAVDDEIVRETFQMDDEDKIVEY